MVKLFANQLKISAKVRDLDTNRWIKGVLWVDEERGEAEAYQYDASGNQVLTYDKDGAAAWATVLLKGRFRLVPIRPPAFVRQAVIMGAPNCGKCGSPLTLRGDELCPKCRAIERGKPIKATRCDIFDFLHKCETCSRDATWYVSDEIEVTPQRGNIDVSRNPRIAVGAYLFDRKAVVGRRYYCDRHYKAPRLLDHKGEVIKTDEDALRPS